MLEFLNGASARLPAGVSPTIGPDATGVGWVYQYALQANNFSLAELRSLQDWSLRFGIAKAEGVAEVASVGGFVKQYNVVVDPNRLRSFNIPLSKVRDVIRGSNMDVGGRTVIPGIIDAHNHIVLVGNRPGWHTGMEHVFTIADAVAAYQARAATVPPGEFVTTVGPIAAMQFPEQRLPNLSELDAVPRPVYIQAAQGGASTNSAGQVGRV